MLDRRHILIAALSLLGIGACAQQAPSEDEPSLAIRWVHNAAEFEALCLQAYRAAGDFLDSAMSNPDWSALPQQQDAADLPPAIILDVDETVVSNVEFQLTLEPPFRNSKLDDWNNANRAKPIPGAVEFVSVARAAGAELFFVTNRPCEEKDGTDNPCPQQDTTIQDLADIGILADEAHVLLANEQPGWDREKSVRRSYIASSHRVIMLIGDDLGDFIPCTRKRALDPCSTGATVASRRAATYQYGEYWGAGWFILPNPMHGSFTTVE
jgi:acid phosphatase